MRSITKSTAYAKLAEIKEEGIETSKYVRMLANSDSVPYDVLVFVNRYKPLDQLCIYNHVYENRRNNPLYKNIVNESASVEDKALAMSSLVTQTLIKCKTMDESSKQELIGIMNIDIILEALHSYMVDGNSQKLQETALGIRDVFKRLY